MSKMGKTSKKIIFYDSDKRYADFRILLEKDGISQASFFRYVVQGYIKQDKDILSYVDKIKNKMLDIPKSWARESAMKRRLAEQKISDLRLSDDELESIFDIIEKETKR